MIAQDYPSTMNFREPASFALKTEGKIQRSPGQGSSSNRRNCRSLSPKQVKLPRTFINKSSDAVGSLLGRMIQVNKRPSRQLCNSSITLPEFSQELKLFGEQSMSRIVEESVEFPPPPLLESTSDQAMTFARTKLQRHDSQDYQPSIPPRRPSNNSISSDSSGSTSSRGRRAANKDCSPKVPGRIASAANSLASLSTFGSSSTERLARKKRSDSPPSPVQRNPSIVSLSSTASAQS